MGQVRGLVTLPSPAASLRSISPRSGGASKNQQEGRNSHPRLVPDGELALLRDSEAVAPGRVQNVLPAVDVPAAYAEREVGLAR